AGQAQVLRGVVPGVIPGKVLDERKVKPLKTPALGRSEVGSKRYALIHLECERRGTGMHLRPGKLPDLRAVAGAGLEHERRTAGASRLKIQDQADLLSPGAAHKRLRAR